MTSLLGNPVPPTSTTFEIWIIWSETSWHCSNSGKLESKQKPTDLKFVNHSITGKVVIVTPRLIVTKTSPTPTEETADGKMPLPITNETNSDQTGLKVDSSQCRNSEF